MKHLKKEKGCCKEFWTWNRGRDILFMICFLIVAGIAIMVGYELFMMLTTVQSILAQAQQLVTVTSQKQPVWFASIDNMMNVADTVHPPVVSNMVGNADSLMGQAAALNLTRTLGSTNGILETMIAVLESVRTAKGIQLNNWIPLNF